jgi:TusE/DsrC/DsvC family sulfur relay protein
MTHASLGDKEKTTRDRQLRLIAGRKIYFDWEDFLWDPNDWDEAIADALALEMGIETLNEIQWRVIRFMQEYYFHHGRSPMNKDLKKGTGLTLMELEALFPRGIRLGARRVSGLPNPKACL